MAASTGFTSPTTFLPSPHTASRIDAAPQMGLSSRREALLAASLLVAMPGVHSASAEELTTKSGAVLQYTVLKSAQSGGGKPKIGDLVAIRFKGAVKASGAVFDDILESPEPYYTRLGRSPIPPTQASHAQVVVNHICALLAASTCCQLWRRCSRSCRRATSGS